MIALCGLFLAAFVAATPVLFNSEVVFLALQAAGWSAALLVAVATVGNVLGSCVTYVIGRKLGDMRNHPRFPISAAAMDRVERWFGRWGTWTLLLCWLPGGDIVVVVAGAVRTPFVLFVIIVTVAKFARFAAVAWLGAEAFSLL